MPKTSWFRIRVGSSSLVPSVLTQRYWNYIARCCVLRYKEDGDANGATEGGAGVERGATRRIGALGSAPKHRASAGLAGAHHRVVRGGGKQHRGRQPAWNIPADRRPLAFAVPAKRS